MGVNVAINGFGRIGRCVARQLLGQERKGDGLELVAINDLTDNPTLAHLFKYDSLHGPLSAEVSAGDNHLEINGSKIRTFSERDPEKLPWQELEVDLVLECTGFFRTKEGAGKHLTAGAEAGHRVGAGQRRRWHFLRRHQRLRVRPECASRRKQRVLHHQLSRAHCESSP